MIRRWDLITIGNLSRNRYWGERDDQAYRSALCTCTLISGENYRLLVDPSLQDQEAMATELFRRTGLRIEEVDHVFITHAHGDHHYGLKHFPHAQWLAAPPVASQLNESGRYEQLAQPVTGSIMGEIDILHTPGHTEHHYSLRFDWEGRSVVVAADAAVTRDYWLHRQGYFNSTDFAAATASMHRLAQIADLIVPGHDNYFLVERETTYT